MKERKILYADEGKVLTDGEIYGKAVFLAEGRSSGEFYEISESEYDVIQKTLLEDSKNV